MTPLRLVMLGLAVLSTPARADFYTHAWTNEYLTSDALRIAPQLHYLMTTANYSASGATQNVATLREYDRLQVDVLAAYGLFSRTSIFARASFANVNISVAPSGTNKATGLGDQTVGVTYRLLEINSASFMDGATIDLQGQVDFPAYTNGTNQIGVAYFGDGTIDMTGGGFLTLPFIKHSRGSKYIWKLSAGVAFTYRTAQFSYAIPWSIAVEMKPRATGFTVLAGLAGYQSTGNDSRAGNSVTTFPGTGASGSYMVNAVNPSLMRGFARVGYQSTDTLSFWAGAERAFFGSNSPAVFNIIAGLKWEFGAERGHLTSSAAGHTPTRGSGFTAYATLKNGDAHIIRTNDRLNLVKIDKGSDDGIDPGQVFDIFTVGPNGQPNEIVARGKVTDVRTNESAITIVQYFKEIWIENGFIARRPVQ
ncbi:hypothetical protein K2X30_00045 [bacterium]|jgi:hypothetical protein|nr:hypothetical protein [bacterium]